jgi:ABC-type multidrug transport system permease subunit
MALNLLSVGRTTMNKQRYSPLYQLTIARFREFYREPAAVFWVYVFPLLLAVALGIAFRERPVEKVSVHLRTDVGSSDAVTAIREKLQADDQLTIHEVTGDDWVKLLRSGKADLVINPTPDGGFELWDEPNRTDSVLARHAIERALYKPSTGGPRLTERHLEETGNRYIDFLLPGLLGMNLMGGGLFGVGFVLADMRIRKLLKRFLATPMSRRDFMVSIMLSRMIFTVPEVLVLLLFGWLAFDVKNQGSAFALLFVIVFGAASFSGLGLLVASRAKTIETVSGLMNLIMLPMWLLSGVFFSAERFPEAMQPFIRVLPLTALNDALRAIMLEGQSLVNLGFEMAVLGVWGGLSFVIALKIFRWQ